MTRAATLGVNVPGDQLRDTLAVSVRRIESDGEPMSEMEIDAVVSTILHNLAGMGVGRT